MINDYALTGIDDKRKVEEVITLMAADLLLLSIFDNIDVCSISCSLRKRALTTTTTKFIISLRRAIILCVFLHKIHPLNACCSEL